MTYDEANRVFSAAETSGGIEFYGYAADNRRFYKYTSTGTEELTFYGGHGENLGVFSITFDPAYLTVNINPAATDIWFAGQMVLESSTSAKMDRLGTNRATSGPFYAYGEAITPPSSDREKFATYTRDRYTEFDYADQRYYASTYGRFNTADPYQASGGPSDPGSWNRYSYTRGDPVNRGWGGVGGVGDQGGARKNRPGQPRDGLCTGDWKGAAHRGGGGRRWLGLWCGGGGAPTGGGEHSRLGGRGGGGCCGGGRENASGGLGRGSLRVMLLTVGGGGE